MSDRKKLLVTGSAGEVGTVVVRGLKDRYEVRGFDCNPTPDLVDTVQADLSDNDALARASEGMDAVIHLAAVPTGAAPWEDILEQNIVGTYNLMEAARQNSVPRVVLASRAGLLAPYPENIRRTIDLTPRPKSYYSVSKLFAEQLGYMYAAQFDMAVVCVRSGNLHLDRPEPSHPHHLGHDDCAQVFEKSVTCPDVAYEVVFGVSGSHIPMYDLEHGRKAIGYFPEQGFDADQES